MKAVFMLPHENLLRHSTEIAEGQNMAGQDRRLVHAGSVDCERRPAVSEDHIVGAHFPAGAVDGSPTGIFPVYLSLESGTVSNRMTAFRVARSATLAA